MWWGGGDEKVRTDSGGSIKYIQNVQRLRHAGGLPEHIVKVTIFMTRIGERGLINPVRQAYFGAHRPASTLVEVSALVDPRLRVEIEAIAVLPA